MVKLHAAVYIVSKPSQMVQMVQMEPFDSIRLMPCEMVKWHAAVYIVSKPRQIPSKILHACSMYAFHAWIHA